MAFFQKLQTCDDFHLSDVEALFFSIFTQKPQIPAQLGTVTFTGIEAFKV